MKLLLVFLVACASAETAPAKCSADADCKLQPNYCKDCGCAALGPGEALPKCDSAPVQCFANPCMNKVARCENAACVVRSNAAR